MKTCWPCLLLLFFLASFAASAQPDSLRTYPNEIGADFRPVIANGRSAGLIFRRHQQKAAWRIRVTGNFSSGNFLDGWEQIRVLESNWRWGREWHLPYKKFRFYYGLDVLTGYLYNRHSLSPYPEPYRNHDLTVGLLPLICCTYLIDERFTASVETNGSYTATMTFSGGRHWNNARGVFISAHAFFLSYRF